MTALTAPPPDTRTCDYCGRRPTGHTARLTPGDPSTPLVDVSHATCYDQFLAEAEEAAWPQGRAR
jgi:hypothetical protein